MGAVAEGDDSNDRPKVRKAVTGGVIAFAAFFGGLGGWSAVAPLESAAIAAGTVSVDTHRKTIQHLEGGIVGEILVRDGDVVKAGQLLIRLDETRPRATLDLLNGRRTALAALESRLIAERDGRAEIWFPDWVLNKLADPKVVETVNGQVHILKVRRKVIQGRMAIHEKRIAQLVEEIKGFRGQIRSEDVQLELVQEEAADVRTLLEKGLARKPRLLALQRRKAEIEGSRARNQAGIARSQQRIEEARLQINDLGTEMMNEVVLQLREAQSELFDIAERIRAAEDVLNRVEIRAPLAGTIVELQVHTPSGVIGSGERLMDIVPSGDRLVIEAQIHPNDIDVVHPGLKAQVRLTAFSMRNTVPVEGTVISVSADRLIDDRSGQSYYLARIWLTGELAGEFGGVKLYPGMPAEVMIVTGAQTALEYIFRPISASLNRSFREQ